MGYTKIFPYCQR